MKLRILLADDHVVMRTGLRMVLEKQPDFEVVGEADNGRQAVTQVQSLQPDIAVLDITMPELNGIDAAAQIAASCPKTSTVMLSMNSDESYVLRALKAGAKAYLLKDSAEADLITALRAVKAGKSFFSPAVSRTLLEDYTRQMRQRGIEDSYELLSAREREILQLIAEGKGNKEIAGLLSLSLHTIETHRTHILQKLNLHSVADIILYAVRKGIIR
jgi:two-component system, NarL family, response regulator NreC